MLGFHMPSKLPDGTRTARTYASRCSSYQSFRFFSGAHRLLIRFVGSPSFSKYLVVSLSKLLSQVISLASYFCFFRIFL